MTYCLFAKLPIPGRVKTRLARELGGEAATELARAFLSDAIAAVRKQPRPFVLAFDAPPSAELAGDARVLLQPEGDLGARMTRVMRTILDESPFVIALGADTPGLPWAFAERAAELLDDPHGPDVVIGPSRDGGFYLLGVRALARDVLDGVRWSTEHARADVESLFTQRGLRVASLPPWFDVDVVDDLEHLRRTLDLDATLFAPATRQALSTTRAVRKEGPSS